MNNVSFVKCPICGKEKRNLTKHVNMAHKLTKEEFLSIYPNTQMVCEETSNLISKSLEQNWLDEDYAKRCSSYTREKGNLGGAHLKGKPKSEETRLKMKAYANSAEGKKIRSENLTKTLKRLNTDEKYVANLREQGRKQMLKNLEDEHYGHKRYKYNDISYRSTWEVEVAKVLDTLHLEYKYEPTRFTYQDEEGILRLYIPDFYLPKYKLYLEVKPDCFKTTLTDLKLQSVRNEGYKAEYISTKDSVEITNLLCNLCRG